MFVYCLAFCEQARAFEHNYNDGSNSCPTQVTFIQHCIFFFFDIISDDLRVISTILFLRLLYQLARIFNAANQDTPISSMRSVSLCFIIFLLTDYLPVTENMASGHFISPI